MIDTALILPSRGLIHSRTVEAVWPKEGRYVYCRPYFSHDNPLPECFNVPIREAMADSNIKYFCIIEEDVVPPDGWFWALRSPLAQDADIAFMDYPVDYGDVTQRYGTYIVTGTGCMMFTRRVAEALMPFRSTHLYSFVDGGRKAFAYAPREEDWALQSYGHHDIDWCVRACDAGFRFLQVGLADHLKVSEYGRANVNDGTHTIRRLTFD